MALRYRLHPQQMNTLFLTTVGSLIEIGNYGMHCLAKPDIETAATLVRSPNGIELTMRGRKILEELEGLLPRMEDPVAPALNEPTRETHILIIPPFGPTG